MADRGTFADSDITMRILLIEDNLGDAILVREYLADTDQSLELVQAVSLSEASGLLAQQTFDALLLDLTLPDAQGLETVRRARQLAPHYPIVVMSGVSDRETAIAALQNGAQDFLVKGRSDGDTIVRALRYAVERADLIERLEQSKAQLELSSELALSAARMVSWDWRIEDDNLTFSSNLNQVFGAGVWNNLATFNKIIHPEDLTERQETLQQTLQTKEAYRVSYRLWNENKQDYIWIEEHGMVRLNNIGSVVAINGVTQDITERKRADLALRRINEAQKRFVGDAAHELRAPLTSIQGNLELLKRYPNMPEQDRTETTADAYREAARLGRLVTDLLALARGDIGEGLRLEPTLLHELLSQTLRQAQHLTKQHHLEFGEFTNCTVEADYDRLKQLMLILLENAIKYTPSGGWVRVSLECDPEWAEIRVEDSGIGISAEDIPFVFDRFFRADKARTRGTDPGGTGLGLPIAQWIVAQHGGEIKLESQLGSGTTTIVRLPIAP